MGKPSIIEADISLAPLTTLGLGGRAKYFAAPTSDDDLAAAFRWAKSQNLPVTCLGGGSNVLVPDSGFAGLVVHPSHDTIDWHDGAVTVGAGVALGELISNALSHGRGGLSWLVGVPGHVGGSVAGNAGSRTEWLGQYVRSVEAMSPDGEVSNISLVDCGFGYRTSAFHRNGLIIVRVTLGLPSVNVAAERAVLAAAAARKRTAQPIGSLTAGCMFRNVAVVASMPPALQALADERGTISAWKLVTEVGCAGFKLGGMAISDQHANFLINTGHGTSDQAVQLMSLVKQKVRDTLGIQLHDEIRLLGF